jgi:inhibitor of cysteine peptidase
MTEIVVTESEAGRDVTAAVGDKIEIVLPENPTTGFRWRIASFDVGVLRQEGDEYVAGTATGVGGGGQRVFRFDAAGRGSANIRLELKRSWEEQSPMSTFAIRVQVP